MATNVTDTTPEAERVLIEVVRRAPVWKRLALADQLIQTCRALALADLRRRYPRASEDELRRRLGTRLLTRDEIARAFGWDPEGGEG